MSTPAVVLEVHVAAGEVDLLALHEEQPDRYPVLLETAALASGAEAQYDWLLIAAPETSDFRTHEWRVSAADVAARRLTGPRFLSELDVLHAAAAHRNGPVARGSLPFVGGFFVYGAYELAGEVEPVLRLPLVEGDLIAALLPIAGAVVRHHGSGRFQVVALPAYTALANEVLAEVLAATRQPLRAAPDLAVNDARRVTEEAPERFVANVERGLQAITAGEVYQTNLSRAWHTQLLPGETAAALYHRLRRANPGPFAGIARLPGLSVLSTSPERLVRVRGLQIDTRPIAGTRPRRPGDAAADAALAAELRAHPKEQAEHVMLVDLERNDLGRLCEPGTVEVDEFMVLEHYAHVHHIVSNVRGIRRSDTTPGQVLRAVFPGGTITGCPKVRCMQLIADLEGVPRGAYTGTMGWLGLDGDMDLNILIRTAAVTATGIVSVRAGAGIVADSVPLLELAETRAKARGLLRGLGVRLEDPA
jgi:anthranilate synthase component 1